ncbi:amidase family protein [Streptomyces longwoodensis]|uniref:amidase family protein n=1 Tax=Streptomyces longwoodensis TaxID=68231 RepID=UPI00340C0FE2
MAVEGPRGALYDPAVLLEAATAVPLAETYAALHAYLNAHRSPLTVETVLENIASPDVRTLLAPLLHGPVVDRDRLRTAHATAAATARTALAALRHSEAAAFLVPTTPLPAPPLGTGPWVDFGDRTGATFTTYIRNTAPAAVWGWPSLTVPAGRTASGLPVGLLLDAPRHHDRSLLGLGRLCARHLNASSHLPSPGTI